MTIRLCCLSTSIQKKLKLSTKLVDYFRNIKLRIKMTTTVNNEHKNIKVPNLRFPEFQGEWEEYTLQDVVTFSNGKAHENCVNDDGDYILVNSKFVSTNGQVQKE